MESRTSATARIFAALALIAAVLIVVILISGAMDRGSDHQSRSKHHTQTSEKRPRSTAKTYTVQTGDTLTAIAHETGVPVAELLALNPGVDPQILIAGKTLQLK